LRVEGRRDLSEGAAVGWASRPYRGIALPGDLQAFDGFEVGGGLVGVGAGGGAVGGEDAVPAAFEAVGGEGEGGGEVAGLCVKAGGAAVGGQAGDDELGADEEAVGRGTGGAE